MTNQNFWRAYHLRAANVRYLERLNCSVVSSILGFKWVSLKMGLKIQCQFSVQKKLSKKVAKTSEIFCARKLSNFGGPSHFVWLNLDQNH